MYRKFFVVSIYALFLFLVISPVLAHAQTQAWGGNCVDKNGVATLNCIPFVFHNIVQAALMFAGTVAVFLLVWAGIKFVMSGGDPKQVQAARSIMTYAIIGLVIVLSSFGIILLIAYLTHTQGCIDQIGFNNCK